MSRNFKMNKRRWFVGAVLLSMVLVMIGLVVLAVVIVTYGQEDRARHADVIVVLGGGHDGTARRARHAAVLYAEGYSDTVICSGGGVSDRRLNGEAGWCAYILRKHGVPESAMVLETNSRSTEENAIMVARLMDKNGWKSAVVVSDDYHLWRAKWMFNRQGVTVWTSPAQATDHSLSQRAEAIGVTREILAIGWFVSKSLLGVKETHTSF